MTPRYRSRVSAVNCRMVLKTRPGTILVVNGGRFAGFQVPTTDNDEVTAWRWNLLPPRMSIMDISVLAASGHVRDDPHGKKGDYMCACHQVNVFLSFFAFAIFCMHCCLFCPFVTVLSWVWVWACRFPCAQLFIMEAAVDTFEAHLQRLTLTPLEALKDLKTKAQRKKCLARVASGMLGTNVTNVAIAGTGITLGIPSDGGDDSDTPVEEAASLVERMIDMQASVRQLYKLPRTCTRADLDKARRHMRPYTAHPMAVFGSGMSQRAAAAVPLWNVVSTQVALAQQCQMPPPTDTKIKVIVAPDATPLWRTSATRCDVYVHVWGTPSRASDVRRWATWWALDGPDDGRCLRAVDRLAGLDRDVEDLEQDRDI